MYQVLVKNLKMSPERLPKRAYNMLLYLHDQSRNTWASYVCFLLHKYGFDEVWVNQGVGDENLFLKTFKERLIVAYQIEWNESIQSSGRFTLYSTFKTQFSLSVYLNEIRHIKARKCLIQMRLGVSNLKVHRCVLCEI